ncbi:MAG: class I SAM-dependent methyltransferase [Chitinophagaceae bacterium]|nr:class I SAM-dependent methyltransferase [Chitinophagaceae bacterium]
MEIVLKYFADFTPKQLEQISALKGLYEEWNSKINVISRKDMDNFYLHHVLHSLAIATQCKKLTVVNEVAKAIGLTNVTTQHSRVEEIKNRKFDVVVSRAVAPLKDLWYWSKPLLNKKTNDNKKPNGLICLKGGDLAQEIFESNCKPKIWEVDKIFNEEYFVNKYLLYIS